MTTGVWVFGYGSLVSPESVAATIGRPVDPDDGYVPSVLHGFARSWNYGSLRQRATWDGPHGRVDAGIVVSLGIVAGPQRSTNGAMVRVSLDEFVELDRRESDYDRIDVTDRVEPGSDTGLRRRSSRVYTYVPRRSAIDRYERARGEYRAAVRQGYIDLVDQAFASLGPDAHARYRATTPTPDVPVVAPERVWLEPESLDDRTNVR